MTIFDNSSDFDKFQYATKSFKHYDKRCPACRASGKLSPYGSYFRGLVYYHKGTVFDFRISPIRFKCASCGKSHALLPGILVPYSPYSLLFKLTVLICYYKRDATAVVICERFCIAVSTLYEWKKCFLVHKWLLLSALADSQKPALAFLLGQFIKDSLSVQEYYEKTLLHCEQLKIMKSENKA